MPVSSTFLVHSAGRQEMGLDGVLGRPILFSLAAVLQDTLGTLEDRVSASVTW